MAITQASISGGIEFELLFSLLVCCGLGSSGVGEGEPEAFVPVTPWVLSSFCFWVQGFSLRSHLLVPDGTSPRIQLRFHRRFRKGSQFSIFRLLPKSLTVVCILLIVGSSPGARLSSEPRSGFQL